MKKYFILPLIVLLGFSAAFGQSKSNEAIAKQIKDLKADKNITLSYDEASKMSKIMVVGDDFGSEQDKRTGVEAMNFGMAFFYPGKSLTAAPDEINFTFWVLTKKPRFAASHAWTATVGSETLDLGDARYVAKPKENMEYLNFKISRANLEKIAKASDVKFKIGSAELKFTPEQLKTFANLLKISNPAGF
ncbi:MAG TPA: hypothetical protein VNB22_18395 [Pyrinomonadaceae bacterium]|nr:hypothetical protein [Pyrinomonadaceae bacterium]